MKPILSNSNGKIMKPVIGGDNSFVLQQKEQIFNVEVGGAQGNPGGSIIDVDGGFFTD